MQFNYMSKEYCFKAIIGYIMEGISLGYIFIDKGTEICEGNIPRAIEEIKNKIYILVYYLMIF